MFLYDSPVNLCVHLALAESCQCGLLKANGIADQRDHTGRLPRNPQDVPRQECGLGADRPAVWDELPVRLADSIGIEISEKYCEIARRRVAGAPTPLFSGEKKAA